ncbi:hypothetical protein OG21DRAFT_1510429 [Imleria badia]|nr:hypothetical protein OG21DRAFT_1510429 [Imleria badia]
MCVRYPCSQPTGSLSAAAPCVASWEVRIPQTASPMLSMRLEPHHSLSSLFPTFLHRLVEILDISEVSMHSILEQHLDPALRNFTASDVYHSLSVPSLIS